MSNVFKFKSTSSFSRIEECCSSGLAARADDAEIGKWRQEITVGQNCSADVDTGATGINPDHTADLMRQAFDSSDVPDRLSGEGGHSDVVYRPCQPLDLLSDDFCRSP